MDGAWPIRPDGRMVCCRAVALVFFKPILRIGLRHPAHIAVTCDLCEHGGRRDVGTLAVAADDASARHGDAGVPVAVDERERRLWGQLRDGPVHGQKRCAEDVALLDLLHGRKRDAVAQRLRDDGIIKRLALFLRELFRVVQAQDLQPRRQHHCRRAHGPCQRSAPGLIHAAQRLGVRRAQLVFQCPQIDLRHTSASGISSVMRPSLPPRYSSSSTPAIRSRSYSPPEMRKPRFLAACSSSSKPLQAGSGRNL